MTPEVIKIIFESACLKKSNLTEEEANSVVDRAATEGLILYFYKCMFCKSFHMTKRPGEVDNHLEFV